MQWHRSTTAQLWQRLYALKCDLGRELRLRPARYLMAPHRVVRALHLNPPTRVLWLPPKNFIASNGVTLPCSG